MRRVRRSRLAVLGLASVVAAALVSALLGPSASATRALLPAPAGLAPAALAGGSAGIGAACVVPPTRAGVLRRGADTITVTAAGAAAVQRAIAPILRARRADAQTADSGERTAIATWVVIPVYVHVIYGTHRGEHRITGTDVRNGLAQMRRDFGGYEGSPRVHTRYWFDLRSIDYTVSDAQYHAAPGSKVDNASKRSHHRAGARSLNIYFAAPSSAGQTLLGWSRFPWQYHVAPRLDSITINPHTLPGGSYTNYNQGDTLTHETGHWLGLFHTFQGGCYNQDHVADTPAEAEPAAGCPEGKDSCLLQSGLDPIHNYMDYSYDVCMNTFSPDQSDRMDAAWIRWRASAPAP